MNTYDDGHWLVGRYRGKRRYAFYWPIRVNDEQEAKLLFAALCRYSEG